MEKSKVYLSIDELKPLIELFTKAYIDTKYAVVKQLPLELAIIEWGGKTREDRILSHVETDARQSFSQFSSSNSTSLSERRLSKTTNQLNGNKESAFSSVSSGKVPIPVQENDLLKELIEKVKPYNHSIAGVLRGCRVKMSDGKKLVLETQYKFHKDRLDDKKTQDLLRNVLQEITGNTVGIEVSLKMRRPT